MSYEGLNAYLYWFVCDEITTYLMNENRYMIQVYVKICDVIST